MVLLLSLLVLLLLAVIALTVSRGSLLQLQMAANEEARMAAMQWALAAVDNVFYSGDSLEAAAQDRASSAVAYRTARFEIRSSYDGRAAGLGGAEAVQGVQLRLVH